LNSTSEMSQKKYRRLTLAPAIEGAELSKPTISDHDAKEQRMKLKSELTFLAARYDYGPVSPAIWAVIKAIQSDINWLEHLD
jgi:hypothetical protein